MTRTWSALTVLFLVCGSGHAALHSVGLDPKSYTSDFMIGSVVVSVVFPESDGSLDPNIETWSVERQVKAMSEIMAGLEWWTQRNTKSPLNFTLVSETISTKYEPITRSYYGESLWIPDLLSKKGYAGSRFTAAQSYVNDLRETHQTDWGFVIFVVDSLADPNGKFADGLFAYAYLGGPYLVLTYDNNGYGIENMDVVAAHETGHIFHALDEYAGASSPNDYSHGYFVTVNGNHAFSFAADAPDSIMRGGIRWGLSDFTRQMIGWRDVDKNGRDDIVDRSPLVGVLTDAAPSSSENTPAFSGDTRVSVLPRQGNPDGKGLTVDTIARVEYRVGGDEWVAAEPIDGVFDSAIESFQVMVDASDMPGAQSITTQDVDIKVTTAYEMAADGSATGGGPPALNLADAHPYPNPFKPNSALGHLSVTFTGLTAGAKVQIFTAAGESVFDGTADTGSNELGWNAINHDGSSVSSGVYYYFITDENGNKKKGKIAVIR